MSKKQVDTERANLIRKITKSATRFDIREAQENCRQLQDWIAAHVALSPKFFADEVLFACKEEGKPRVGPLVRQLIDHLQTGSASYEVGEARNILNILKKNERFGDLSRLADAFSSTGVIGDDAESIKCELLYAQALIDSGRIHPAILLLTQTKVKIKNLGKRRGAKHVAFITAECSGLFGRAYKQLYVNNANLGGKRIERYLNQAIEHYGAIYFDPKFENYEDRTWHGINIASVARRAEIAGIKIKPKPVDSHQLAQEVLEIIEGRKGTDRQLEWDEGTALEASLLLGKPEVALQRTAEYCRQKDDSFKYASTLRQLKEVLQLDPNDETTSKILRLLRAMQLKKDQKTSIEIKDPIEEAAVVADVMKTFKSKQFEAVFGDTEYKALEWYKLGLERASAVGKISTLVGKPHGTGFLVRGADVDQSLGDELVLITNSHVISEDSEEQNAPSPDPKSLAPDNASVIFHAVDPGKAYKFRTPIHRNSHRNQLDFSILRFQAPPTGIEPLPVIKAGPRHDGKQRVYIIGHPQGGGLSFSIQENRLTGYDPATGDPIKALYRTPTRGGSSGSPVFNEEWRVFALHHKTEGGNNRGVLFSQIAT